MTDTPTTPHRGRRESTAAIEGRLAERWSKKAQVIGALGCVVLSALGSGITVYMALHDGVRDNAHGVDTNRAAIVRLEQDRAELTTTIDGIKTEVGRMAGDVRLQGASLVRIERVLEKLSQGK